jgi:IS5 family transposase
MPFDPSDFVHFRKRIGEEGARVIFGASLVLHQDKIDAETEVIIDTTVQEKNITFPTDNKLRLKIIAKTKKFAKRHEIKLKQAI